MNWETLMQKTVLGAVLGLLFLQPAVAQSNCKQAKGQISETLNAGGTGGSVANAGCLNGTSQTVYPPDFVVTPNPTTVVGPTS